MIHYLISYYPVTEGQEVLLHHKSIRTHFQSRGTFVIRLTSCYRLSYSSCNLLSSLLTTSFPFSRLLAVKAAPEQNVQSKVNGCFLIRLYYCTVTVFLCSLLKIHLLPEGDTYHTPVLYTSPTETPTPRLSALLFFHAVVVLPF